MMISYCMPCMNRLHDLKVSLPSIIKAAEFSPPVQIVIIDYNSSDGLNEYIKTVDYGNLTYKRYTANKYYHMAHARNLALRAAEGDYIIMSCTDIIAREDYFAAIRSLINYDIVWLEHPIGGVVCCQRGEFIASGGYDERFEFYGKEDKDLIARLRRRGGKHTQVLPGYLGHIPTFRTQKYENYDPRLTPHQMKKYSMEIWKENIKNKVLTVNEGKEWGKWHEN